MPDWTERRQRPGETDPNDDLDLDQRDESGRRSKHRLPLRIWVEGRAGDHVEFSKCSNLSAGGMFLETTNPFKQGERVEIEFNLPGQYEPVQVVAEAVSSLDESSADEAAMGNGFKFLEISDDDTARIEAFVRESRKDEGS